MAEETFKPGDVVVLKSEQRGSPTMVIKSTDEAKSTCIWFKEINQQFEETELLNVTIKMSPNYHF